LKFLIRIKNFGLEILKPYEKGLLRKTVDLFRHTSPSKKDLEKNETEEILPAKNREFPYLPP